MTSSDATAAFLGIFLREEIFSCLICTIDGTFQNPENHSASLRHVATQERFNLFFVANSNGFACKLCCTDFDWKEVKGHALSHRILPWWQPADKYKKFFQNHIIELEIEYYCYPCDLFFEEWSSAYIHTSHDNHRNRMKIYPVSNDFSSWGLTQVPFHTFVSEALGSTMHSNTIQCTICKCSDIGMKNIASHVQETQHQQMKVNFMQEMKNWKDHKAKQSQNSFQREILEEKAMSEKSEARGDTPKPSVQNSLCIYVSEQGENKFCCKICDLQFLDQLHVEDHIRDATHARALKTFGCENIRLRKQQEYYCLCCDCRILGIKNVHRHVRGVRHTDSLSLIRCPSEKRELPTNTNISFIEEPEQQAEPRKNPNFPFMPKNHMETQDGHEFHCRLCNEIIQSYSNVKKHIVRETHLSKNQQLLEMFSHQGGNDYYCRCCNCTVPGIENIYRHINAYKHAKSLNVWTLMERESNLKKTTDLVELPKQPEIVAKASREDLSYDHVSKLNDTMSYCRICDCKDLASSHLADHVTGTQHKEALKRFANEILPKKNDKYLCKCCDVVVYSMNNVYGHLHGNKHKSSQTRLEKPKTLGEATSCAVSTDEKATKEKSPNPEDNHRQEENDSCNIPGVVSKSTSDLHSHNAMHKEQNFDLPKNPATSNETKSSNTDAKPYFNSVQTNGTIISTQNDDSAELEFPASISTKNHSEKKLLSHVEQNFDLPKKPEISNGTKSPNHDSKPFSIEPSRTNGNAVFTKNKVSANSTPRESISINGNSEKILQSPKDSNIQRILQLFNSNDDYIHNMRDKLRETERGMKLCSIKGTKLVYCLVCRENVALAPKNYFKHLNSAEHCECLEEIKKDHALFDLVPGQLSQYVLIDQYIEELTEESVHCHSCNQDLINTDNTLKRHINDESHKNTRKRMHLKAIENFEKIKPKLQCDWYDIHEYWCVLCDEHFQTELNFVRHLKGIAHSIATRTSENCERMLMYDFCEPCALLWFGYQCTYADHCDGPAHLGVTTDNRRKWKELPKGVKEHFKTIDLAELIPGHTEEYKTSALLHLDNILIKDLEKATKSKFPNYFASTFRNFKVPLTQSDFDVRVYLLSRKYEDESLEDDKSPPLSGIHQCLTDDPECWNVTPLPACDRMVFKAIHKPTGTRCGIFFQGNFASRWARLHMWIMEFVVEHRRLLKFLRQWLNLCGLATPQGISESAFYLYVIFYVQRKFGNPQGLASLISELSVESINCCDLVRSSLSRSKMSVGKWLGGFFRFYAKFDYRYKLASPWLGREIEKRAFADPANPPETMIPYIDCMESSDSSQPFRIESPMCIQDVYNLRCNLAEDVTKANLSRFREYCAKSADVLDALNI